MADRVRITEEAGYGVDVDLDDFGGYFDFEQSDQYPYKTAKGARAATYKEIAEHLDEMIAACRVAKKVALDRAKRARR